MPDKELIHSSFDINSVLAFAFTSGFRVISDVPQRVSKPWRLNGTDIGGVTSGGFYLILPEWQYGPFQMMTVTGGYNKGKYFVQPRVNFAPITVFFGGERIDEGRRRFGAGTISFHSDWLETKKNEVKPTPPDVKEWFDKFVAHFSGGIEIKAGVHRFLLGKGVVSANFAECLPPFDFIKWDNRVVRSRVNKSQTG